MCQQTSSDREALTHNFLVLTHNFLPEVRNSPRGRPTRGPSKEGAHRLHVPSGAPRGPTVEWATAHPEDTDTVFACDIGSTTIAMHLVSLLSGRVAASSGTSNPQIPSARI